MAQDDAKGAELKAKISFDYSAEKLDEFKQDIGDLKESVGALQKSVAGLAGAIKGIVGVGAGIVGSIGIKALTASVSETESLIIHLRNAYRGLGDEAEIAAKKLSKGLNLKHGEVMEGLIELQEGFASSGMSNRQILKLGVGLAEQARNLQALLPTKSFQEIFQALIGEKEGPTREVSAMLQQAGVLQPGGHLARVKEDELRTQYDVSMHGGQESRIQAARTQRVIAGLEASPVLRGAYERANTIQKNVDTFESALSRLKKTFLKEMIPAVKAGAAALAGWMKELEASSDEWMPELKENFKALAEIVKVVVLTLELGWKVIAALFEEPLSLIAGKPISLASKELGKGGASESLKESIKAVDAVREKGLWKTIGEDIGSGVFKRRDEIGAMGAILQGLGAIYTRGAIPFPKGGEAPEAAGKAQAPKVENRVNVSFHISGAKAPRDVAEAVRGELDKVFRELPSPVNTRVV